MKTQAQIVDAIVDERLVVSVNIQTKEGDSIGSLSPVTRSTLDDEDLIGRMTDWRNRMRTSFLTQAPVTNDTTRSFIQNALFGDATRLLFVVRSLTGPVGTIGLKVAPPWVHGAGPTQEDQRGRRLAELANLLRGTREGHPMLMYYGEMALMEWAFREFDIEMFWTAVPSDNRLALSLHRSAGFRATDLIPLIRTEVDGTTHFVPGEAGQASPNGVYAQRIELERGEFMLKKDALLGNCSYGASTRAPARAVHPALAR